MSTLLEHINLDQLPTGAVDWVAEINAIINKLAGGRTLRLTAAESLSKGNPFYVDANGKAAKADDSTDQIGLWLSSSTAQDVEGFGQIDGLIETGSWNEGAYVYINSSGALSETAPNGNARPIAYAIESGKLLILGGLPVSMGGPWKASLQTSNATPAALFTKTLEEGKAYLIEVKVAMSQADLDRAGYVRRAVVYRPTGGSATLQGSVQDDFTAESETACDVTIDVSGNDARVMVTGTNDSVATDWKGELTMIPVP